MKVDESAYRRVNGFKPSSIKGPRRWVFVVKLDVGDDRVEVTGPWPAAKAEAERCAVALGGTGVSLLP